MSTRPESVFLTRSLLRRLAYLGLVAGFACSLARAAGPARIDYGRDVLPILSSQCFQCHGPDAATRKAGLRLDTPDGPFLAAKSGLRAVVPSKLDESELHARITAEDATLIMPPPKSGKHLTSAQVATLSAWIEQGAEVSNHWAFVPPRRPTPPAARMPEWCRDPIDCFVLARLDAEHLKPAPEAGRETLIRRVTLDLTGLPPTLEEIDTFLDDHRPDAYERLVDCLLASPSYGERMAMEWLDGARYADTNGYQNDFARIMWPWRDWVINAFNRNQPFDQFIIEQIAGDLLPNPSRDQRVATGFNRNNRTVTEAGSIEEEWRIENAVDRVETTSMVFLGFTMGCARCHDHKYDPLTQKEFYRFLAFFSNVNEKGVYTETRGNVPPLVSLPTPEQTREIGNLERAIADADRAIQEQEKSLPEQRTRWEAAMRARPLPVEPDDWSLRAALTENLRFIDTFGEPVAAAYRGEGGPHWTDGPLGPALALESKDAGFVEVAIPDPAARNGAISYGGWVRRRGDGAILSKMDDAAAYRGFDLLMQQGRLEVHFVHAWPDDAIKVATQETIPENTWSHIFVTYDGASKAKGVTVYINGRPTALAVVTDKLCGTFAVDQPVRIGKRSASLPFQGDLADVRIYPRALKTAEIQAIADRPALLMAQRPMETRSKPKQELLARIFRDRFAVELHAAQALAAKRREQKSELEKSIPNVMVMEDAATPRATYVLKRGNYDAPDHDQKVDPNVPAALSALPSDAPRDRLGLARWLVAPDHPLTGRVAVNRVWQQHFGTGLVKTAENFGVQGEPPSHPELLDWLATTFTREGWDLKALHRAIVTSATYRQSSNASAELVQRDPENRLLARGPRLRLPAEAVRDNALTIAGLLVKQLGGPSIKPYQPEGLWAELAGGAGEGPYVQDKGPALYRRSLYIYRKRTVPHPAMSTFDAPSREVCQVKRPRTNTPLQALQLLNDVTYVEAARNLAQRMLLDGGPSPAGRLRVGFRRALGREPTQDELMLALRGLERYRQTFTGDPDAAGKLIHHGESPVSAGLDPVELAAYTVTAGVLLGLDETITRE